MSSDDDLRKALKAFRKKLKLMQLEDDSKLGHSPLTGPRSSVVAIQPPSGFGREIWQELAQKGFLTHEGGGMYTPTGKNL